MEQITKLFIITTIILTLLLIITAPSYNEKISEQELIMNSLETFYGYTLNEDTFICPTEQCSNECIKVKIIKE
jgi:Tfp pilus assembly protein PilE